MTALPCAGQGTHPQAAQWTGSRKVGHFGAFIRSMSYGVTLRIDLCFARESAPLLIVRPYFPFTEKARRTFPAIAFV